MATERTTDVSPKALRNFLAKEAQEALMPKPSKPAEPAQVSAPTVQKST